MRFTRPTPDAGATPTLVVDRVHVGYSRTPVLRDVTLYVGPGERVALVGANGAGKTTLLRAISGLLRPTSGGVRFGAVDLAALPAHKVVGTGVVQVPEGRQVFTRQTVLENLLLGARSRRDRAAAAADLERVLEALPIMRDRLGTTAGNLSGGQQQILAIGRALMAAPRLLMIDELSLGLAPRLADEVADIVRALADDAGLSLLIVEQNAAVALDLSRRTYVMRNGAIAGAHKSAELADHDLLHQYLGA